MIGVDQPVCVSNPPTPGRRPAVVELVGPAASGKSSLLRLLGERDRSLHTGLRPARYRHLVSAVALAPTFIALHRGTRGVLWKEMKRITYLRSLHRILEGETGGSHRAIVLDEGPVYMLARLGVYGGERVRSRAFESWWRSAFAEWASTLDLIVRLDARDEVLADRIRARPQHHRTRGLPDPAMHQFLASYRAAYNSVLSALTVSGRVRALSFRTDLEPLDRIAERVASEIPDGGRGG